MTTPIDPGDTLRLRSVIENALEYGLDKFTLKRAAYDYAASAVARAVCPTGHHVIADDDLRRALSIVERHTNEGTSLLTDRLRSAIGDER